MDAQMNLSQAAKDCLERRITILPIITSYG